MIGRPTAARLVHISSPYSMTLSRPPFSSRHHDGPSPGRPLSLFNDPSLKWRLTGHRCRIGASGSGRRCGTAAVGSSKSAWYRSRTRRGTCSSGASNDGPPVVLFYICKPFSIVHETISVQIGKFLGLKFGCTRIAHLRPVSLQGPTS